MTSWFFIEMAAKSALICSLALMLAIALRHRAAADRAMVLRVGVGLLLALPLIDFAFPVLQIEAFAPPALPASDLSAAEMDRLLALAADLPATKAGLWDDPAPLLVLLWAAGALAILGRLAVGLITLRRWTRSAAPAADPVWLAALERARAGAGAPSKPRLMVADHVPGPLGWGWRNPVILIDHDTYAERDEADAILAHEMAHVVRRDWIALMLTRLATALFWFNPLIWTLARETVQQAEEAADAHAARMVEPTRYAETLLSWGQIGRGMAIPANSIAPGGGALSRRVRAVLEPRLVAQSAGSRLALVAILLCIGVAAPVAALELVEAARPVQPEAPARAPARPAPAYSPAAPAHPREPAEDAPEAPGIPGMAGMSHAEMTPALEALREAVPRLPHGQAHPVQSRDRPDHESRARIEAAVARMRAATPDEATLRARFATIDSTRLEARIRAAMPDETVLRARITAAMSASRRNMAHGAAGMARGAEGMERGADRMDAQARLFRDPRERERIIARERERGQAVTHRDLLDAADDMEEGAREMREGARSMRRGAAEMLGDD